MKALFTVSFLLTCLTTYAGGGGCASFMNVVPVSHPLGCNAISLENLTAHNGTNKTWTFNPAAINAATGLPVTSLVVNSATLSPPGVWPTVYWPQASIPANGIINIGYNGCTQDFYTCDCNPFAAGNFFDAPLICNTDHYCGNTAAAYIEDFLQNGTPAGGLGANGDGCLFCGAYTMDHEGSIENNSWLKFIADATSVPFTINVFGGCYIQFAVYQYNPAAPLGTNGVLTLMTPMVWTNVDQGFTGLNTITATGLTPGMTYYLHFDGHGGADCDYEIGFTSGIVTMDATASDDLVCAGQSVVLTATPNDPTATYTWTDNFGNTYANADQITVNPTVATTYSVEVLLSGCQNNPETVQVNIEPCPLPVEMTSLSVQCSGEDRTISWSTLSESGNDFFTIERSYDDQDFKQIGVVDGLGNSNDMHTYSFLDNERLSGSVYYRIKQVDINGEEFLSDILSTEDCTTEDNSVNVTYDKGSGALVFTYSVSKPSDVAIQLVDLQGKTHVHRTDTLEGGVTKLYIPVSHLQHNEVYLLKSIVNEQLDDFRIYLPE